jgi:hypothetical protein
MKRLCFLSPDIVHTRQVVKDLKARGIADRNIYVIARHGTELEDLPDAGPERDDFLPAYERGLAIGGVGGLIAGLIAMAFAPAGIVVGGGAVLLIAAYGAGMGGMLTAIAGASFPSSRLSQFAEAIETGKILVMADVPRDQVEEYEQLVRSLDPEVEVHGIEPHAPLLPQ